MYEDKPMEATMDYDRSALDRAIESACRAEAALGEALAELYRRLEPVTRPEPPTAVDAEALHAVREERSPAVAHIDSHAAALYSHVARLRGRIERLDV